MILDGKKEAALLREEIKKEIIALKEQDNKVPGLTVILIGDFVPSQIYVRNKEKNSKEVGINSEVIKYSKDISEKKILEKIEELNNDNNVSGILLSFSFKAAISFFISSLNNAASFLPSSIIFKVLFCKIFH